MTCLYTNRPMKKQKLHLLARFATLSIIGAIPVLATNDATAQQDQRYSLPPIVQGSEGSSAPVASSNPSYTRDSSKQLMPTYKTEQKPSEASKPEATESGLLAPIGSGVVKQVAGRYEPGQPRIARAFSPAKMPIATQVSNPLSMPAPAIQFPNPISAREPQIASPRNFGVMPGAEMPNMVPTPPVISGSLVGPNDSGIMIDNGPIAAPSYFDAAPVNSIPMDSVVAGCGSCGGNGCDSCQAGGCDSCGPGGCYNANKINCDYGTYGSVSAARRYAHLEFLYLTRADGDINNSNFNPVGGFDWGPGLRLTFGQRSDMTQGREFSYFGTLGIDATQTTNDSRNRLNALFVPGGGIVPDDLSAFFGASQQIQFKETSLHSLEYNKVRWGWDVLKSFIGWRYVYLDDQYQLSSTAPNRDPFGNVIPGTVSGRYRMDTINHMLGAHIGAELFYDIGYRLSVSGLSKYGVYANINKVDHYLENGGFELLDVEANNATISSTYEINLMAHYQLRQTARLRFGYNAMFLGQVATVSDNVTPLLSPFTGFDTSDEDDAFIHGFSFGLEIYR